MCVLLGFTLWALLFGPLLVVWWWPDLRERAALARRGSSREVRR